MGTSSKEYTQPEWLTIDFLLDILRNHFKNETLEINELVVKKATISQNSGYASELHRASLIITMNGKEDKFSVIVKVSFSAKNLHLNEISLPGPSEGTYRSHC